MKKNVLESNPDDLVMSFRTETGVYVEIYDTYCKNFTQEDKDRVDEQISEILYRSMLRKHMEARNGTKSREGAEAGRCTYENPNQQDEALAAGPGLRSPAAPAQVHTADLLWGRFLRPDMAGRAQGVPDRRFGPARPPDRGEIPRTDRGRAPAAGNGIRRGRCEP